MTNFSPDWSCMVQVSEKHRITEKKHDVPRVHGSSGRNIVCRPWFWRTPTTDDVGVFRDEGKCQGLIYLLINMHSDQEGCFDPSYLPPSLPMFALSANLDNKQGRAGICFHHSPHSADPLFVLLLLRAFLHITIPEKMGYEIQLMERIALPTLEIPNHSGHLRRKKYSHTPT